MPIHSTPQYGFDAKNSIGLCFGEGSNDLACKSKPVSVRMNYVFVIDLKYVSYKSLYADDNGIWETSSPRRYFNVEVNAGIVSEELSSSKGTYTHMLTRQYGKHKSTDDRNGALLCRIISTVKTRLGQRGRYAVVQYILKIVLPPHGHSYGSRPHLKTDPAVLEKMKTLIDEKPQRVFGKLLDDAGGHSRQPLPHRNQETECKFIMSDVIVKEIFRKQ